jgi:hypothetical protein
MKFLSTIVSAWICAFLILHPTISYAGEPIPIQEGEVAPFDGVILTTADAAILLANLEQQNERCQASIDLAVATAVAAKQLELDTCNSNFQIRTDLYNTQLSGYQDYSIFLEDRLTRPKLSPEWMLVIGIVAGVGITIGAGVAMNQASAQ